MHRPALQLTLWVKSACDACEAAEALMASLSAAMGFDWSTREGEFGDSVPLVTTSEGKILAEAPLVASELADAIRAITIPD